MPHWMIIYVSVTSIYCVFSTTAAIMLWHRARAAEISQNFLKERLTEAYQRSKQLSDQNADLLVNYERVQAEKVEADRKLDEQSS